MDQDSDEGLQILNATKVSEYLFEFGGKDIDFVLLKDGRTMKAYINTFRWSKYCIFMNIFNGRTM